MKRVHISHVHVHVHVPCMSCQFARCWHHRRLEANFATTRCSRQQVSSSSTRTAHEGFSKMFVSHTWLRGNHPDTTQGVKFALQALRSVLQRAIRAEPQATLALALNSPSQRLTERGKAFRLHSTANLRRLADGFVFFDYMVRAAQASPDSGFV